MAGTASRMHPIAARIIPISVRVEKDGQLVWETAPFAVGHHQGSRLPGEPGNVVLSSHISIPRKRRDLQSPTRHRSRRWHHRSLGRAIRALSSREDARRSPNAVGYIEPTKQGVPTLVRCVPDGVHTERLIVRADLVA